MKRTRSRTRAERPLEALGVSAEEERAYRVLLAHRMLTAGDVASRLGQPLRRAQRLLEAIEAKGLATHSPERPRRYIAASPQLAVEALIAQRQTDLVRARAAIPELKKQAAAAGDGAESEQMVELITSRAAAGRILDQLLRSIQTESVNLQRAPVLFSELATRTTPRAACSRRRSRAARACAASPTRSFSRCRAR